jgi:hypothetical protein
VIGFFFGLFNAGDYVQIGGDSGFILRGWIVILGSVLLGIGALGFLASYDERDRIRWSRAAVPLLLMATAGGLLVGLGETPEEFCGDAYLIDCP